MSLTETLKSKFSSAITDSHADYGDETVIVAREKIYDILKFLKETEQFDLLLDICGVDYMGQEPRFEVVYHLYSLPKKTRLRIKTKIPEKDCQVKSVVDLWEAANWFEREAYDMYGIRFEGHPKLQRLLMWEGFEGYPLRKDYPMNKRQPIPEPLDIV